MYIGFQGPAKTLDSPFVRYGRIGGSFFSRISGGQVRKFLLAAVVCVAVVNLVGLQSQELKIFERGDGGPTAGGCFECVGGSEGNRSAELWAGDGCGAG
jgi:hypothetical protein